MKFPFLPLAISLSLGMVSSRYAPSVTPVVVSLLVILLPFAWFLRGRKSFFPVFLILIFTAGWIGFSIDGLKPENSVHQFVSDRRLAVTGIVATLPDVKCRGRGRNISFVLKSTEVNLGSRRYPKPRAVRGQVWVYWIQPATVPSVGDKVRLYGLLKKPRQAQNPGGFDQTRYLAEKNIHAMIEVIGPNSGRIVAEGSVFQPARWIGKLRLTIASKIDVLYQRPESSMLKAVILGFRSEIASDLKSAFVKTGTIHLLSISGIHITMVAGGFYLLFLALGAGRRMTAMLTMAVVLCYVSISGMGLPAQRAGWMAGIVLLGVIWGRPSLSMNALCIAFFLMILARPRDLWNVGFQLSYLCVFSLIAFLPRFSSCRSLPGSLGGSLVVTAGTFPLVLYYFNVFSPVSLMANFVAIPVFDAALFLSLFSLLFSAVPLLGEWLIAISSAFIQLMSAWIVQLSRLTWGYWFLSKPTPWQLFGYYGSLAGLLFFWGRNSLWKKQMAILCAGICLVTGLTMMRTEPDAGFFVNVLCAGRDPVIHVRFSGGRNWLIGAGRRFPSDQGEKIILPYFQQKGIRALDGILVPGSYKKHWGGLMTILRELRVQTVVFPGDFHVPEELSRYSDKFRYVRSGETILELPDRESLMMEWAGKKDTAVFIEAGQQKICFVPCGLDPLRISRISPPPDILILPFVKKIAPWNGVEEVRLWVLPGAETEAALFLQKQAGQRYFLNEKGALNIRVFETGFLTKNLVKV